MRPINIQIDRRRLRIIVVVVATLAALISFGTAVRAHNLVIDTRSKDCKIVGIVNLFLSSDSTLRGNEVAIRSKSIVDRDNTLNSETSYLRGLAVNDPNNANLIYSFIGYQNKNQQIIKNQNDALTKLTNNTKNYWAILNTQLSKLAKCGKEGKIKINN